MQNRITLGSGNDDYQSVVSDLVSLIQHVQASLRSIEQAMAGETFPTGPESATGVVVLDDVSPRYIKAAEALKACDVNLGVALDSLLDSDASHRRASAHALFSATFLT